MSSYSNEILAVNAMHGGRTHDSRVFRSSRLFHYLERQQEAGERVSWLIGIVNNILLTMLTCFYKSVIFVILSVVVLNRFAYFL